MDIERRLRYAIQDASPGLRPVMLLVCGPILLLCWLAIDVACLALGIKIRAQSQRRKHARGRRQ